MSSDDLIDWFRLSAYFAGECTAEERDALEQWIGDAPERRRLVQRLRVVYEARNHRPALEYGRDSAIAYVMAVIRGGRDRWRRSSKQAARVAHRGHVPEHTLQRGGGERRTLRRVIWRASAALVLGVVVAVAGWSAEGHHVHGRAALSTLTYTTGNGERANIRLPDGSTVVLNVASRLDVPMDYMAGNHVVKLTGEGLFTVSHHDGMPLTVMAGKTATRVLGTSFVVRRYVSDTTTMVAVREGKVAVGETVVTANRLAEVGRDGVAHVRSSDTSPFTFATGILTIDGMPLSAAVVELDRWYDADIRLGSPGLVTQPVKGEFATGSLADLAMMLEDAFDVRAVRNGRVLTLYPRR